MVKETQKVTILKSIAKKKKKMLDCSHTALPAEGSEEPLGDLGREICKY